LGPKYSVWVVAENRLSKSSKYGYSPCIFGYSLVRATGIFSIPVGNKIPSLIPVSIELETELEALKDEIFSTTFGKDPVLRGSFGFSMGGFLFSIISISELAFKFKEFSFIT
jgi:hypothetical protein